MVADDLLGVLVTGGFDAEQSDYVGTLAIASEGMQWQLQVEAMVLRGSISVALVVVSDSWAAEADLVKSVGGQLHHVALAYAAARGVTVFEAPVPRW
jgi:hypothetical protein